MLTSLLQIVGQCICVLAVKPPHCINLTEYSTCVAWLCCHGIPILKNHVIHLDALNHNWSWQNRFRAGEIDLSHSDVTHEGVCAVD